MEKDLVILNKNLDEMWAKYEEWYRTIPDSVRLYLASLVLSGQDDLVMQVFGPKKMVDILSLFLSELEIRDRELKELEGTE